MGGWSEPWPLHWGGAPTPIAAMLAALRAAVGKGHAADADGVEWRWREARAIALAIIGSHAERAQAQFEPRSATDALSFYRELCALPDGIGDELVRARADELLHSPGDVTSASIAADLKAIDERLTIVERPWAESTTTIAGRAFEDWGRLLPFNLGRGDTLYPNYSDAFELVVLFDAGLPPFGNTERLAREAAVAYLDDALPAWCTYRILGGGVPTGFILDLSPLDITGFG